MILGTIIKNRTKHAVNAVNEETTETLLNSRAIEKLKGKAVERKVLLHSLKCSQ